MPKYAKGITPEQARQFERYEQLKNPFGEGMEWLANYFTGHKDAEAAESAAAAQEEAAQQALALQREMWEQQRADQQPWMQAGQATLADLLRQMQGGGFDNRTDPSQLANDPGFQFRMAEGQKALERSAAARGGLRSGATLKSLARYSQGVASDEFNNAWNRTETSNANRYNRLANLAGVGQASAQHLGGLGQGFANSASSLYGAIGNANSAGIIGQANGYNGGASRTLGTLMGIPQQQRIPQQGGAYYPDLDLPERY